MRLRPELRPGPHWRSLRHSPRPSSRLGRGHPSPDATPLGPFGASTIASRALGAAPLHIISGYRYATVHSAHCDVWSCYNSDTLATVMPVICGQYDPLQTQNCSIYCWAQNATLRRLWVAGDTCVDSYGATQSQKSYRCFIDCVSTLMSTTWMSGWDFVIYTVSQKSSHL